jgi:hypothetical protein
MLGLPCCEIAYIRKNSLPTSFLFFLYLDCVSHLEGFKHKTSYELLAIALMLGLPCLEISYIRKNPFKLPSYIWIVSVMKKVLATKCLVNFS